MPACNALNTLPVIRAQREISPAGPRSRATHDMTGERDLGVVRNAPPAPMREALPSRDPVRSARLMAAVDSLLARYGGRVAVFSDAADAEL